MIVGGRSMADEEKKNLKKKCFKYLNSYDENDKIKTKLENICGKTGAYKVPDELFQKRTQRKNRVLISWQVVKKNNLSLNKLNTFENGVVVEFINNDYFNEDDKNNPLFIELKNRLGSNENVSSIISFRTEDGSSSSRIPRDAFLKFINNTEVMYKNEKIVINESNYTKYKLNKTRNGRGSGIGNDKWDGFLFVSIKGGQQDTIETHKGQSITLFNPACEYANESVCLDIDLTLSYFAMCSINPSEEKRSEHNSLLDELEKVLKETKYDLNDNNITLYDYCNRHPALALEKGKLIDPIQLKEIDISYFKISDSSNKMCMNITHNEAVNNEKYYWDDERKCILSPARPTNLYWSFHLSNMMQQEYNLYEYIKYAEELYKKREEYIELYEFTKIV